MEQEEEGCVPLLLRAPAPALPGPNFLPCRAPVALWPRRQPEPGFTRLRGFRRISAAGRALPAATHGTSSGAVQPQSAGGDNRGGAGRFGCSRWEARAAFLEVIEAIEGGMAGNTTFLVLINQRSGGQDGPQLLDRFRQLAQEGLDGQEHLEVGPSS